MGELFGQSSDSLGEPLQRLDTLSHNPTSDYLKENLPSFCLRLCCLKPSRLDRRRARARENYIKEMDVVQLLRNIRFFALASKTLLSQEKEKEFEILSQRTVLDESEDELQITEEIPPLTEPPIVTTTKQAGESKRWLSSLSSLVSS